MPTYNDFNPEYSAPAYHTRHALSLCLASHLAYQKNPRNKRIARRRITGQAKEWGFDDVEAVEVVRGRDIDTQGFIAANESRILAAFRGTESLPDWLTNLQTVRDPGPWRDTRVHEGFQDAFHAAALQIGGIIGRIRGTHEVWLTGHSLGGALAVLLAATLLESRVPVTGLYTFGAPRVGNIKFASRLNEELTNAAHWRIVNQNDLVPHVPAQMFFSHAGNRNRMLLMDNAELDESEDTWKGFIREAWSWMGELAEDTRSLFNIADPHRLDSEGGYLNRLAAIQR